MIVKSEHKSEGDYCDSCDEEIKKGRNYYIEMTSYEYSEFDTFCYSCKLKIEKSQKEHYEQFNEFMKGVK